MPKRSTILRRILLVVLLAVALWKIPSMVEMLHAGEFPGIPALGAGPDSAEVERLLGEAAAAAGAPDSPPELVTDKDDLVLFTPDGEELTEEERARLIEEAQHSREASKIQNPMTRVKKD